jgi:hypothetical protein
MPSKIPNIGKNEIWLGLRKVFKKQWRKSKMKVDKEVLKVFLDKVKMTGSMQITECILKFSEDGLHICTMVPDKVGRVDGWLNKAAFKDYIVLGNVGVNDFNTIIKVVQRFGKDLLLTKEGNLLTLKGDSKSVDVELISENFLATDITTPNLKFTEVFNIKASQLIDIYNDVTLSKDAVLSIITKEKLVEFKNTGKYKFVNTLKADTCKGGVSSTFGQALIDATTKLDGDLEIAMAQDYPIKITEKTENSIISIIVAPRVDSD